MEGREDPRARKSSPWTWIGGLAIAAAVLILALALRGPATLPESTPKAHIGSNRAVLLAKPSVTAAKIPDQPSVVAQAVGSDICGVGRVKFDPEDPLAAAKYVAALSASASRQWLSRLRNSSDVRARAAGLYLEGKISDGIVAQPMTEPTRDALVQLAVGTKDPPVYAIALLACRPMNTMEGACGQVSAAGWARIDPGNAAAWLLLAGSARDRHDASAEAEAFAHAAAAPTFDPYNWSLLSIASPDLPADATPLQRLFLSIEVIGIEAAETSVHTEAYRYCPAQAMQEGTVRQQCSDLAELLATRGGTLIDLQAAATIGEHAGWAKQRVAGIRREADALFEVILQNEAANPKEAWNCRQADRENGLFRRITQLGELDAARDALERSELSEAELAAAWRASVEKMRSDALQEVQEAAAQSVP